MQLNTIAKLLIVWLHKQLDIMPCELTSNGDYVIVNGPIEVQHALKISKFRTSTLQWKVPSDHESVKHFLPKNLLKLLRASPNDVPCGKPVSISDSIWDKLFEYQKETVNSVIHRYKGRCLLAHEMGLGKTVQAIALMQHYGSPVLIVCPSFLKRNWEREIEKWAPGVKATIVSYDICRQSHLNW